MMWDRQGQMGLVGSGTKAIAQHLISGLAEMGPDVSRGEGTLWGWGSRLGCLGCLEGAGPQSDVAGTV